MVLLIGIAIDIKLTTETDSALYSAACSASPLPLCPSPAVARPLKLQIYRF